MIEDLLVKNADLSCGEEKSQVKNEAFAKFAELKKIEML